MYGRTDAFPMITLEALVKKQDYAFGQADPLDAGETAFKILNTCENMLVIKSQDPSLVMWGDVPILKCEVDGAPTPRPMAGDNVCALLQRFRVHTMGVIRP